MSKYFWLVIITVLLNASSQILMKHGMAMAGKFEFAVDHVTSLIPRMVFNPLILLGLFTMSVSMVTHLFALSRFDVSFVFPFISFAFVVVAVYGALALGEPMSASRAVGITLICLGTYLIAQTA